MSLIPENFNISFLEKSFDPPLIPNDEKNFEKFDFDNVKHVANVKIDSDLRHLIYHLTNKMNELTEKIAAIFYWLSFTEISSSKFINSTPDSLEFSYNQILEEEYWQPLAFEFLCRCIGVSCVIIKGIARTIDYVPNISDGENRTSHIWNGIYINNKWYLCDILWCTEVIVRNFTDSSFMLISKAYKEKHFINQYFLMSPILMQTTHFPNNQMLRFLSNPITYEQFDSYPIFTTHYFDSPLANLDYISYKMVSEQGYFKFVLPFSGESSYFHLLEYFDETKKQLVFQAQNNETIKSYSLIEVTKENVILYFRFPYAGNYFVTLCYQSETNPTPLNSNFKALLKWKIVCKYSVTCIERFFGCNDVSLGPSWPHLEYYGLVPINFISGIVNIEFSPPAYIEISFTKLNPEVIVMAKIKGSEKLLPSIPKSDHSNDITTYQSHGHCLDWLIDEEDDIDSEITITIRLPKYGEYALEIYANIPKEGDKFVHVAQYMVDLKENKANRID